jgi:hypothetical protein
MAYGFEGPDGKFRAEKLAQEMREKEPRNRFEVEPHSYYDNTRSRNSDGSFNEYAARTWGVVEYEPYVEQHPWRCRGFVWF